MTDDINTQEHIFTFFKQNDRLHLHPNLFTLGGGGGGPGGVATALTAMGGGGTGGVL